MKQLLVKLEPRLAAELERVAPARSRKRSEFVRMAIRKAIWDLQEKATEAAYRRMPDSDEPVYFDAAAWEGPPARPTGRRRRRRRKQP